MLLPAQALAGECVVTALATPPPPPARGDALLNAAMRDAARLKALKRTPYAMLLARMKVRVAPPPCPRKACPLDCSRCQRSSRE